MNPELQKLIEYDKTNLEIARLTEEIAALPRRVAEIEAKLANTNRQVEEARAAIKEQEAGRRKLEAGIQDRQQKISKLREQSLAVKTNEQYKALMHEIEFAEKEISGFEENILLGMETFEGFEKALHAAEAERKRESAEIEKEKEHARSLTAVDQAKLAELNQRKKALRSELDAAAVAHYERIAQKRRGAISEAVAQKCLACNVMLRPQRYNELLSGKELVTCESCGRILYHDPNREPVHDSGAGVKSSGKGKHTRDYGWYYMADIDGRAVFAAFVNHKGSCSMRLFSAASGESLGAPAIHKKTTFKEAFKECLMKGVLLNIEQPNLEEECSQALPPDVLEELQIQARYSPETSTPVAIAQ